MKKIVLTLTAALIMSWQGLSFADSSVDQLIQKLKDKGISDRSGSGTTARSNFYKRARLPTKNF